MRFLLTACAVALSMTLAVSAQDSTTKSRTEIKADDATIFSMTGCLRQDVADPGLTAGETALRVVVGVQRQRQLLEVVGALHPAGCLADLLDGGQQKPDEDGDDGDDHQQLDQREGATGRAVGGQVGHQSSPR